MPFAENKAHLKILHLEQHFDIVSSGLHRILWIFAQSLEGVSSETIKERCHTAIQVAEKVGEDEGDLKALHPDELDKLPLLKVITAAT